MRVNSATNSQSSEVAGTRQSKSALAASEARKKEKGGNAPATAAAVDPTAVKADISSKGKEFARAKAIAKDTPDVREEKIAELKRRIAAGQYNVNTEAVADRMVNEHLKSS